MIEAKATARYVRTSAQKAGLVLDLIRGKDVNRALATLKYTRKGIADDVAKVLRSAIALRVYLSVASALLTSLPRISASTSPAF